ncbi:serine/arginine-rich splicing factor 2-like [Molossus molossus]|uniref:serine/arginine-rich splicing factor 2-like n=1 Tax=Molossus molossus TaxID=27622 RepID=UPI0017473435|nr:serine/arginine-rich splicing factor 2-like [Molossus molossus]
MNYRRPPYNVSGMTSVKVDNLNDATTANSLLSIFQKFGEIGDVYIPRDRFTQKPRGFAFVRFLSRCHAEDAIDALDQIMVDGRVLRVHMARYDRLANLQSGGHEESLARRYEGWSLSPVGPSALQPQGAAHSGLEKSPARSPDTTPAAFEYTSTTCFESSLSMSGSSSAAASGLGSRSLPAEEESASPPKNPSKSPEDEGAEADEEDSSDDMSSSDSLIDWCISFK